MKKYKRIYYFFLIFVTIALGIFSRKMDGVPTFFGDILYAIMIYFGVRFILINYSYKKAAFLALLFCFSVEFLQLYTAEWMVSIRKTALGHYVLGEGFLWSDLVCYTFGVAIAFLTDENFIKKK